MSDYVEVTGHGHVEKRPDVLAVQLAAEATHTDVAQALAGADRALRAMAATAREHGVADADIRTSGMTVHPQHDHEGRRSGYAAWLGLDLVLRELDRAGGVLSEVVAAGGDASRVQGVALGLDAPADAMAVARESAYADARRTAEQLATLAGRELGPALRVSDHPVAGWPRPIAEQGGRRAMAMAASVEPGSTEVAATVTVRWQLR